MQPEVVKLGSADITPLIKNEIIEKEKQKSSEFHKFKDIDVSNSLKLFFPKLIEEKPDTAEIIKTQPNEIEITDENINEILDSGFIDNTSTINEQFFTGGENWYFDQNVKMFRNQSNEMFVNFLQTNVCMELMRKNKIKIHISSGDIYINNVNTNESLYDFLAVQNNENYVLIDKEFIFDGTLNEYYNTYLSNSLITEDDFMTNRNSKFLFLHFNNVLQMTGITPYKIRHTVIIKNEKALELMQKSNWQYFISNLMNIAKSNLLGSSEYTEEEENEIRPYIDNVISHGEMYKDIYTSIALSFHTVIENIPLEELKKLYQDLNDNEIYQDLDEVTPEELLDIFLEFYYFHGRFPGENRLIVLPSFNIPREISNSSIDLSALFLDFRNTYFQPLASIQGICALTKYVPDEHDYKKLDVLIKNTVEEFFSNLLESNLNLNNLGEISYESITELMNITVKNLNKINETINHRRQIVNEEINSRINQYENDQIQDIEDDFKNEIELFSQQQSTEKNKEKSFKENVDLKKEDYVNQLNKFLVEIQPGIEGIRQLNSEDKQKISLDIENPNVKIEETFDQNENDIKRIEDENVAVYNSNLPKIEFNKPNIIVPIKKEEEINSNTNLIKEEKEDNLMNIDTINIEDDRDSIINVDDDDDDDNNNIHFGIENNKKLIDIDQREKENIEIEIDDVNTNNLNIKVKKEQTELGFFPEQPHKDNLGQQIKIEDDDDDITEYKKEDPEMDTNFERSIAILPTSHSLNNLRKRKILQEKNEQKSKKFKLNYNLPDFKKYNKGSKITIPEFNANYKRPLFISAVAEEPLKAIEAPKKSKNKSKKQPKKNSGISKAIVPIDYFKNISLAEIKNKSPKKSNNISKAIDYFENISKTNKGTSKALVPADYFKKKNKTNTTTSKALVPADYFKKKNKTNTTTTSKALVSADYFKKMSNADISKALVPLDYLKKNSKTKNKSKKQPKKSNQNISKAIVPADYFKNISRKASNNHSFENNQDNIQFLRPRPSLLAIKPKKSKTSKKIKKENIILPTSHSINLNKQRRARKRKNTTLKSKVKRMKKEIDEYFNDQDV